MSDLMTTDPSGTSCGPAGTRGSRRRRSVRRSAFVDAGALVLLGAALFVWALSSGSGYGSQLATDVAMFVTLSYSWNIVSGFTGYISFGHVVFYGFGAFATALMIIHWSVPWYLAAVLSGLMSGLLAVPIGLVLLRLRGIYFALGMFGLVYIVYLTVTQVDLTGGSQGLVVPGTLAQTQVLAAMLLLAGLTFGLNAFIARSRFGLRAMAIRDDEEAASAMGVRTTWVKVAVFALSAVPPAIVGGFVAYNRAFIDGPSMFDVRIDLQMILFTLAGGIGTVWGPLIGAAVLTLVGEQFWSNVPQFQLALFGALLVLITLLLPKGIVSLLNRFGVLHRTVVGAPDALPDEANLDAVLADSRHFREAEADQPLLECVDVSIRFGGVRAVTNVSLTVRPGETVCIIGANGAGKTTLFNAITGLVTPHSGEVRLDGALITAGRPDHLAREGLGRTFQIPRLFESMTVYENILVAALGGRMRDHALEQTAWVVRLLRLEEICFEPVESLAVGHRRLVELARALALQPKVILLDEVMAGLAQDELDQVRDVIRRLPSYGVSAVAGVEHVLKAIIDLADRIVVLDHGELLLEGPPKEILSHPDVIKAYLGEAMF